MPRNAWAKERISSAGELTRSTGRPLRSGMLGSPAPKMTERTSTPSERSASSAGGRSARLSSLPSESQMTVRLDARNPSAACRSKTPLAAQKERSKRLLLDSWARWESSSRLNAGSPRWPRSLTPNSPSRAFSPQSPSAATTVHSSLGSSAQGSRRPVSLDGSRAASACRSRSRIAASRPGTRSARSLVRSRDARFRSIPGLRIVVEVSTMTTRSGSPSGSAVATDCAGVPRTVNVAHIAIHLFIVSLHLCRPRQPSPWYVTVAGILPRHSPTVDRALGSSETVG